MEAMEVSSSHVQSSAAMLNENELILYPVDKEYIGKIFVKLPDEENPKKKQVKSEITTIVILDRSGSMGNQVERFVNVILPKMFKKLNYENDTVINLITFDSNPEVIQATVEVFPALEITCQGCTNMKGAIDELHKILVALPEDHKAVRLLTISDGEIWDQEETQIAANELSKITEKRFEFNSQAVRLFTSNAQPDTRALSSVLQFNNVTNVNLLDLSQDLSHEEISTSISELFVDDYLTYQITLNAEENIFKKSPWTEITNKITIFPGENIFWLEKIPTKHITIEDLTIPIKVEPEVNLETYGELLKKKIGHYMTQLKILKVVNTAESTEAITNMVKYFQNCENNILNKETDVQLILNNPGLQSRLHYLKTLISRRNKTFSIRMAQIANDEKISQLNAAQQADYLRTVDTSKNSRGLARRALNQGIDFNETVRKEVRQMLEHIDELKEVNDKEHFTSFYSKETTLGGIHTLCELAKQDLLEDLDANDILLLLNIVGVACYGPIGDFPDPMTWRINEIHYGCYISLSDILTAYLQSSGNVLKTPGTEKDITNVIPIFEDNRIAKFLKKHAPSLLEYTCSIGMRRVIADVPMTCGYTMCSAIWKMVEDLNFKKTELHLKTFERLVNNYAFFVGKYFEHIMPCIKDQGTNHNSYYIANNGITNMISPLINLYKLNDSSKLCYVPNILRALYTYEIWQAVRRLYKNKENSEIIAKDMLKKLLGVDIEKNKTILKPLFEDEPEKIKFYNEINLDETYFEELCKNFYYIGYCTLIPKYFEAVISKKTDTIKNIPKIDDDTITKSLDIDYNLKSFILYNIFQALFYTTKISRVDTDSETMKILDLKYEKEAEKIAREYIRKQFENKYTIDLADKKKQEQAILVKFLVDSIVNSKTHEEIVNLMRNGVTRGNVYSKITNSSSLGYMDLKTRILDTKQQIPLRINIIKIFLLGTDFKNNNEPVWNNGSVNFVYNLTEIAEIFKSAGLEDDWVKVHAEYKERGVHIYRVKNNYHGHGNDKPSYYALGYPTLMHYKNDTSEEQFKQYCEIHNSCCGVPELLGIINKVKGNEDDQNN